MTLDCSHYRRPPLTLPSAEKDAVAVSFKTARTTIEKTISCFERTRERRGQAALTVTIAPTKSLAGPAGPDAFPLHNVQ